jgi:hypothetical protein
MEPKISNITATDLWMLLSFELTPDHDVFPAATAATVLLL